MIEEQMPRGAAEVAHCHRVSRQFFYVLDGTLTMVFGERAVRVGAGSGIEIEPGVMHEARNESDADVRFLVISQPPSHGDRWPRKQSESET